MLDPHDAATPAISAPRLGTGGDAHGSRPIPLRGSDPFALSDELECLRRDEPLSRLRYPDGHLGWIVTSHALASSVLTDERFSTSRARCPMGEPEKVEAVAERADDPVLSGFLLILDPPRHTQLRRMQTGRFTVKQVNAGRPALEAIVERCLDAMESLGSPVDLIEAYAAPLTSLALCEVLGVPTGDREEFERLTAIRSDPSATAEEDQAAFEAYADYVRQVIEAKRRDPGDDVLSDLVQQQAQLTDEELAGIALQLFGAGHDTTATQLATSVFALLAERSRWQALQEDEALLGPAIEELLRYLSAVPLAPVSRRALEDVELAGELIRSGECVTVTLATANHDPARFPEPGRLDLARDASGHLALGQGRHMCLGQHLARLELECGLRGLLRRFPGLELAVPAAEVPMRHEASIIYGPERLMVTWP